MLRLNKISLTHYKNYAFSPFEFTKNVVGISGLNGIGKTNLLDAIYYCCFTKSYFTGTDSLNINFNKDGFRLEAEFENSGLPQKVICINRGSNKKDFSLNDVAYDRLASHVGLLPAVIIAPDDTEIIIGGSDGRRRYLDTLICQLDNEYLQQLIIYNKVLQQRNSLLRQFATGKKDLALMEVINDQLCKPGEIIFEKRTYYTGKLIPMIESNYVFIAANEETIRFNYSSQLSAGSFADLLRSSFDKDLILQRTTVGIHKDELHFMLNDQPFKSVASQGQRKSLLFALKLAQYSLLKLHKRFSPLLLLDDVFEKLDRERMQRLLTRVCLENEGQVFITDTHGQRLEDIFRELGIDGQLIEL